MKNTEGTYKYIDKKTGTQVFIKYLIKDCSFTHEFGIKFELGFDSDLDSVLDEDGNKIVVKDDTIEEIIDDAFEALENTSTIELIENSDNIDDKATVGWQFLFNPKVTLWGDGI